MSSITIKCPHCRQELEADDSLRGTTVDCPQCGKPFRISALKPQQSKELPERRPSSVKTRLLPRWAWVTICSVISIGTIVLGVLAIQYYRIMEEKKAEELERQAKWAVYDEKQRVIREQREAAQKQREAAHKLFSEALLYYKGEGVLQDYAKATELFQRASNMGDPDADGYLALIYRGGLGNVTKNMNQAIYYAQKAGEERSAISNMVLGDAYLYGFKDKSGNDVQNFNSAYKCFCKASDDGYYYGMLMKGLMQYQGVGTQKDVQGAAQTFYRCCKNMPENSDAAKAAMCLGQLYAAGIGVGHNQVEADKWNAWGWNDNEYVVIRLRTTNPDANPGHVFDLLRTSYIAYKERYNLLESMR